MDAVDEAIDKLLADRRRLMAECEKLTTERNAWRAEAMEQSQLVAKLINNLPSTEYTLLKV